MARFDKNFLKDRARTFFRNAAELMRQGEFDVAAFNFEQASQLYLKHYLFSKIQNFPRTHSISDLIQEVAKIHPQGKKLLTFLRKNKLIAKDLEEVYLTSRYLPIEIPKEKVGLFKKFVSQLRTLLQK